MNILWNLQNKLKTSGFLMLCVMVFVYFLFYTINGERGLLKYLYLKKEIAQAQKIADQYNIQKTKLEDKVRLLSSSSLDLDMLEERARVVLNLVSDDEFVILDNSIEE
ncbi:MAG: septum formation initiator family protein [Lactobacillaceae bacterium]|jgi:cell division protein FtsB|nr:septum formation initiator family protein [Lactobacillaceae bacterium]